MMKYKQAIRIETGFFPILRKLICVVLCLFSLHASGHYMRDSIAGESVIFVAKGTTIVNHSESENYHIIYQNVITKSDNISSKPASVKAIKQRTSTTKQKHIAKTNSLPRNSSIVFENIPSKDTYEKHQNSIVSFVIPNYHQLDKKCKNGIFNSVFICSVCSYSENIILKNILIQRQFYPFESFFARPPPM